MLDYCYWKSGGGDIGQLIRSVNRYWHWRRYRIMLLDKLLDLLLAIGIVLSFIECYWSLASGTAQPYITAYPYIIIIYLKKLVDALFHLEITEI